MHVEKFPEQATWSISEDSNGSILNVDWKKYGKYAFDTSSAGKQQFLSVEINYHFSLPLLCAI